VTVSIQTGRGNGSNIIPGHGLGTVALACCCFHSLEPAVCGVPEDVWRVIGCLMLLLAAGPPSPRALTGCGASNGFFGEAQRAYTVILTATSGTVQHTTTVTLNVQ